MVEATVRAIGIEDRRCTSQVGVRGMQREAPLNNACAFVGKFSTLPFPCHYASPVPLPSSPSAIIGRVPFGTKAPLVSPPRPTFVNGRCTAERESASRVHIVPLSFRSSTRPRRGGEGVEFTCTPWCAVGEDEIVRATILDSDKWEKRLVGSRKNLRLAFFT